MTAPLAVRRAAVARGPPVMVTRGMGALLGVTPIYWGVAAVMGSGVWITHGRHKARELRE